MRELPPPMLSHELTSTTGIGHKPRKICRTCGADVGIYGFLVNRSRSVNLLAKNLLLLLLLLTTMMMMMMISFEHRHRQGTIGWRGGAPC